MPNPLLILYATTTGNAQTCAERIAEIATGRGYVPRVCDVEHYDVASLGSEGRVLFCVSSYGDGGPPAPAGRFWARLRKLPAGGLAMLRYGIYAIGDASFANYCGFGKKLDAELELKGAAPILRRSDNGLDFESGIPAWCDAIFAALPGSLQG